MAFGTSSAIFQYVMKNLLGGFVQSTTAPTGMTSTGFLGDTMMFALYGNSGTPSKTVATAALCSYNGAASAWVTGDEVSGTGYTAGGGTAGTLTGKGWATDATAGPCFTAANPSWTGATITAYGGLLYDASISGGTGFAVDQGVCFNAFGGSQSVTGGTFTVAWATAGSTANTIFNISV